MPSVVATDICTGSRYAVACRRPLDQPDRPRRVAATGSSVSPNVSARKNSASESVEPSMSAKRDGSTASSRSRLYSWKPVSDPLCMNSQFPCRNGWQLLRCTGVPDDARMCAKSSRVSIWSATSRRFSSFHAGSMLLKTAGRGPAPYQPMPKPSPLVVVAPSCECRLWSISEWTGLNRRSDARIGSPEYAIHLHMHSREPARWADVLPRSG